VEASLESATESLGRQTAWRCTSYESCFAKVSARFAIENLTRNVGLRMSRWDSMQREYLQLGYRRK